MRIHFFPTVWSDAILLENNGHFGMVDTCFNTESVKEYLARLGTVKLDFVLLTHFHPDHYNGLTEIIRTVPTERVIFKEFSGFVGYTNLGTRSDGEYIRKETEVCEQIKEQIIKYSRLVPSHEAGDVFIGDTRLTLFNTEDIIRTVFHDKASPLGGIYEASENQNTVPVYFEYGGRKVLLAGDITDYEAADERISRMNLKLAKKTGKIDIYKAAHHGRGLGNEDTLALYRPDYTVITNRMDTVAGDVELLKKANPQMDIYIMGDGGRVFDICENGKITVSQM